MGGKIRYAVMYSRPQASVESGHTHPHVAHGIQQLMSRKLRCLNPVDGRGLARGACAEGVTAVIRAEVPVQVVAAVLGCKAFEVSRIALPRVKAVLQV